MSPEQPALVAEPAAVRRRIISAPQRTKTPVALIIRERGSLPALEEKLQAARPVVVFPSLSHFCTDSQRSERWAGVIIARACAWDARLDEYVLDRACMALYGDDEGYGWPESVPRLRDDPGVDTWLGELDQPRVRTPVARPKKKRVTSEASGGANGTRKQRVVFSLWDESRAKVVSDDVKVSEPTPVVQTQPEQVRPTAQSEAVPAVALRRTRGKAPSAQQSLPFPAADAQGDENHARRRALAVSVVRERTPQPRDGHLSKKEELLARMGVELGLSRARELLSQLRLRAREIASR